jgi:hypothetical protein
VQRIRRQNMQKCPQWHDVDMRVTWQWPNGTRFRMTNWKMPRKMVCSCRLTHMIGI